MARDMIPLGNEGKQIYFPIGTIFTIAVFLIFRIKQERDIK